MTKLEAQERAARIWRYASISISPSHRNTGPGIVEWYVEVNHGGPFHQLDCHGHALCHPGCKELEILNCT